MVSALVFHTEKLHRIPKFDSDLFFQLLNNGLVLCFEIQKKGWNKMMKERGN